jgi:hypothetical protein
MNAFELIVAGVAIFIMMPLAWVQWSKRSIADAFETQRQLGATSDAEVGIAFDGKRRWVEVVFREDDIRVHAFLTSSEALLVAQWLRTAALPGRTLAGARRRRQRSLA